MKFSFSRFIVGIIAAATFLFFAPTRAKADTYQLLGLAIDNEYIYGIDGSGTVVLDGTDTFGACSPTATTCYITYVNGLPVSGSNTAPAITDSGGPAGPGCPALPGLIVPPVFDLCNNGHEAYGVDFIDDFTDGYTGRGVFVGPDPYTDQINADSPSPGAMMNSSGDFVFDDATADEIIEVLDVPVPEPDSLFLLATGAIAGAFTLRRRFCLTSRAHPSV